MRYPSASAPRLSSDRLLLRRVVPTDVTHVREISVYDGIVAASDAQAAAILRRIDHDRIRGDSIHWGICLRPADEVVGTCGFYRGFGGEVGEVGYVLRESYRGRGVMTEALRLVVAFGLDEMGLEAVVAYIAPTNAASAAVAVRAGFVEVPSARAERTFVVRRAMRSAAT